MSELPMTYAGLDYWDRTHSLIDGTVTPNGIDLNYLVIPPGAACFISSIDSSRFLCESFS